ncbi:Sepiapterin reductase [Smittium mucronatum]|uniref:Sepiapterin reductase n=1 Tax=Smittium mucronatum TaxID=133383 RepID=A0A1R0H643_9FUNG|nr:Sepiapterin reductase [Smittium mucronatum]
MLLLYILSLWALVSCSPIDSIDTTHRLLFSGNEGPHPNQLVPPSIDPIAVPIQQAPVFRQSCPVLNGISNDNSAPPPVNAALAPASTQTDARVLMFPLANYQGTPKVFENVSTNKCYNTEASGFGVEIAFELAAQHSSLQKDFSTHFLLFGREESKLSQTAQRIESLPEISVSIAPNFELSSVQASTELLISQTKRVANEIGIQNIRSVLVIFNSGTTGDLSKRIGDYDSVSEISSYYSINLVSFTANVSQLVKYLHSNQFQSVTLVQISSLLAVKPYPYWSLYASAKAARDMLFGVIAQEYPSIKTLNYAPGPLDNTMQASVVSTIGDPIQRRIYSDMKNEGNLVNMNSSARKLVHVLSNNSFVSGSHIDFYDE